jgi:hypothetical protein
MRPNKTRESTRHGIETNKTLYQEEEKEESRCMMGVDEKENWTGDESDERTIPAEEMPDPPRRDGEGASVEVEANEGTTLRKNQQNCRWKRTA